MQKIKHKSALVIPSRGIGDALLMMIASHQLLNEGLLVTTCHPALKELQEWFHGQKFIDRIPENLSQFDLILIQNDNSAKIHELAGQFRDTLSIFYASYTAGKNPQATASDYIFNADKTMADNISEGIAHLLDTKTINKDNGLTPSPGLVHRKHKKRVLIHPMSSAPEKNWKQSRYLKLAQKLQKRGFEPLFVLSADERKQWEKEAISAPIFSTLADLAKMLYESGFVIGNDSLVGHLASNLEIPSLIIADDEKRMRLWRPGWLLGQVITPSLLIPNMKFLRLRRKFWKSLIPLRQVLSTFDKLVCNHK